MSAGAPAEPLVLWGRLSSCNVQKALWALEELQLPYERIEAGGDYGGLDTPAYRALNPHGRVPTLVDGPTIVWESEAIVRYLAARYGSGFLWPEDPAERAMADRWMAWTAASLYPDWIALFWKLVRVPEPKRDGPAIARHLSATMQRFAVLDRHMEQHRWLGGGDFTMADIPAGMMLYRWFEMPIDRPPMPSLTAWYERLRERAAYRTAVCIPFDDLIGKESY